MPGIVTADNSVTFTLPTTGEVFARVSCPAGTQVIGGGFNALFSNVNAHANKFFMHSSAAISTSTWQAVGNVSSTFSGDLILTATVYCAPVP